MRFGRTLVSFIGLTVMLLCAELWLIRLLAAQESRIVFSNLAFDNWEIYVMDDDGGNRENLSNHPVDDEDPDWSSDGTKIAFVSNRDLGIEQIYVMDADGKNQIKLTYGPRRKRDPDWSPDGGKIAFTVLEDWKDDWFPHIAVMDANGNNRERFEDHAMQPSWSPDGKRLHSCLGEMGTAKFTRWALTDRGLKGSRTMCRANKTHRFLPTDDGLHTGHRTKDSITSL